MDLLSKLAKAHHELSKISNKHNKYAENSAVNTSTEAATETKPIEITKKAKTEIPLFQNSVDLRTSAFPPPNFQCNGLGTAAIGRLQAING